MSNQSLLIWDMMKLTNIVYLQITTGGTVVTASCISWHCLFRNTDNWEPVSLWVACWHRLCPGDMICWLIMSPGHYPLVDCVHPDWKLSEFAYIVRSTTPQQPWCLLMGREYSDVFWYEFIEIHKVQLMKWRKRSWGKQKRRLGTWCSVMTVRGGFTCNVLDCRSHQQMWSGFVVLVCGYCTISKTILLMSEADSVC